MNNDVRGGGRRFFCCPDCCSTNPHVVVTFTRGSWPNDSNDFFQGRWRALLDASRKCAEEASVIQQRKRRRQRPDDELKRRAERAIALVQMGELSSGRQALEGASLAPGTRQTLGALRDPNRRPPLPRDPLPQFIREHQPSVSFALDEQRFASNLRSARRGAAAGVSGMTTDHLRPVLDNIRDTHLLHQMGGTVSLQLASEKAFTVPSASED